jgi:hypothetical protein
MELIAMSKSSTRIGERPRHSRRWTNPMIVLFAAAVLVLVELTVGQSSSLAMPADAQRPDNLESVRVGQKVAERHCALCHRTAGEKPQCKSASVSADC